MLLNTLPGDIPGLLRHGSPVLWNDESCLVQCSRDGTYRRVDGDVGGAPDASELVLDLTDPTGRWHAAMWTFRHRAPPRGWTGFPPPIAVNENEAQRLAIMSVDMTPTQIDTLARLVLRLAGRTS